MRSTVVGVSLAFATTSPAGGGAGAVPPIQTLVTAVLDTTRNLTLGYLAAGLVGTGYTTADISLIFQSAVATTVRRALAGDGVGGGFAAALRALQPAGCNGVAAPSSTDAILVTVIIGLPAALVDTAAAGTRAGGISRGGLLTLISASLEASLARGAPAVAPFNAAVAACTGAAPDVVSTAAVTSLGAASPSAAPAAADGGVNLGLALGLGIGVPCGLALLAVLLLALLRGACDVCEVCYCCCCIGACRRRLKAPWRMAVLVGSEKSGGMAAAIAGRGAEEAPAVF